MEEIVLQSYKEFLQENNIKNFEVNLDVKLGRESGLDSLGVVNFILILEEKLDINLDSQLANIRKVNNLRELAKILSEIN